jgi:hypothetical protein
MNPHGPDGFRGSVEFGDGGNICWKSGPGRGTNGGDRGGDGRYAPASPRCHPDSNGTQGWTAAVTIRFRRADRRWRNR